MHKTCHFVGKSTFLLICTVKCYTYRYHVFFEHGKKLKMNFFMIFTNSGKIELVLEDQTNSILLYLFREAVCTALIENAKLEFLELIQQSLNSNWP